MKITEGLKSLEKALEKELTEFFILLGASEAPEFWPEHAEPAKAASQPPSESPTTHH